MWSESWTIVINICVLWRHCFHVSRNSYSRIWLFCSQMYFPWGNLTLPAIWKTLWNSFTTRTEIVTIILFKTMRSAIFLLCCLCTVYLCLWYCTPKKLSKMPETQMPDFHMPASAWLAFSVRRGKKIWFSSFCLPLLWCGISLN